MTEPHHQVQNAGTNDDAMARLLRLAGPRDDVPADRAARVRAVVLDEIRRSGRQRATRRRAWTAAAAIALAASLVVGILMIAGRLEPLPAASEIVATVEMTDGQGSHVAGGAGARDPILLSPGAALREGDVIETGPTGRLALRTRGDVSLRFDAGTRARLVSAEAIEIVAGAVYVDSGRDAARVEVRTAFGIAHDIGTQFEVRVSDASVRLRVRSGGVELRRADGVALARAGMELISGAEGTTTRTIAVHGPDWEWTSRLAPVVAIDGRPLSAVLEQICREQGWTLRYADAAVAAAAPGVILHGSIAGLSAGHAVEVVLTTSGLAHRLRDGELIVFASR
jgi:ferric-dicitrate binding protein FerR (iron transport regulator)